MGYVSSREGTFVQGGNHSQNVLLHLIHLTRCQGFLKTTHVIFRDWDVLAKLRIPEQKTSIK